jgi:hypothetical protein
LTANRGFESWVGEAFVGEREGEEEGVIVGGGFLVKMRRDQGENPSGNFGCNDDKKKGSEMTSKLRFCGEKSTGLRLL